MAKVVGITAMMNCPECGHAAHVPGRSSFRHQLRQKNVTTSAKICTQTMFVTHETFVLGNIMSESNFFCATNIREKVVKAT